MTSIRSNKNEKTNNNIINEKDIIIKCSSAISYATQHWGLESLKTYLAHQGVGISPEPTTVGHNIAIDYDNMWWGNYDRIEMYSNLREEWEKEIKDLFYQTEKRTLNEPDNIKFWYQVYQNLDLETKIRTQIKI